VLLRLIVATKTKTPTTPTAIGYVRVSSEDQKLHGCSLEAQETRLRAWAQLQGIAITIDVDAGISGKAMHNRPALQRALAAMRSGSILVVTELSRLSRRAIDSLHIAEHLTKRGAELVSLKEQIPPGPVGKMILAVMSTLNEIERDGIASRTAIALGHLKAQGKRVGAVPFGFRMHEDGETLVEDEHERAIVEEVRSLRAAGLSMRGVVGVLAERGRVSRVGRPFQLTQVSRMLEGADVVSAAA
jgi:site-specific DNA recombinase